MPTEGETAINRSTGQRAVYRGGQWVVAPGPIAPNNPSEGRADRSEARDDRTETRDVRDTAFTQAQQLRKEYQSQPSIAEYRTALGTFSSALKTKPSAQGDQSLITSYAKMLDPNSVVREGEFAVTASTESTVSQIKARLAKEFGWEEGGMLTPQGRNAVKAEMRNLVLNRFKPAYDRDRIQYQRYAQSYGFEPYQIVGEDAATGYDPQLLDPVTAPEGERALADPGANERETRHLPPEYQDAYYRYLQDNWGKIDPQDYVEFRTALDAKFGLDPNPAYLSEAEPLNKFAATGGTPGQIGAIPNPKEDMGFFEGMLNSAAQSPTGAFLANMGNAGTLGLPGHLAGQDKLELLREAQPTASGLGEIAGNISGTMMTGAAGRAANAGLLANPVNSDVAYSSLYGATQDTEDPLRGALYSGAGAFAGNRVGRLFGSAFPEALAPVAQRQAQAAVPDSAQGRQIASNLYDQAEAAGLTADPAATQDLLARTTALLQREGRLTPAGAPIDLDSPTSRGYRLIEGFSGNPMTPTQAGNVRGVLGEGRAGPDAAQARVSGLLTDEFDQWADPVLPGIDRARQAAERYIQGDIIENATELAESDASRRFSQSGLENALRSRFGALDRGMVNGTTRFPEPVANVIRDVARGTTGSNIARNIGKLAPTSPMAATVGPIAAGAAAGSAAGMPLVGAAAGLGTAALGVGARALATRSARERARLAALIARDPAYAGLADEIREMAGARGGHFGAGIFGTAGSMYSR